MVVGLTAPAEPALPVLSLDVRICVEGTLFRPLPLFVLDLDGDCVRLVRAGWVLGAARGVVLRVTLLRDDDFFGVDVLGRLFGCFLGLTPCATRWLRLVLAGEGRLTLAWRVARVGFGLDVLFEDLAAGRCWARLADGVFLGDCTLRVFFDF